jgi:hypothetical protein
VTALGRKGQAHKITAKNSGLLIYMFPSRKKSSVQVRSPYSKVYTRKPTRADIQLGHNV